MPKVIHCYGNRGDTETARYIGRPGPFGNPFILHKEADRYEVLDMYSKWFHRRIESDVLFREQVMSLDGYDLSCWCAPRLCHGDVILKWLNDQKKRAPRVVR